MTERELLLGCAAMNTAAPFAPCIREFARIVQVLA